jgi:hypothetical protein
MRASTIYLKAEHFNSISHWNKQTGKLYRNLGFAIVSDTVS